MKWARLHESSEDTGLDLWLGYLLAYFAANAAELTDKVTEGWPGQWIRLKARMCQADQILICVHRQLWPQLVISNCQRHLETLWLSKDSCNRLLEQHGWLFSVMALLSQRLVATPLRA